MVTIIAEAAQGFEGDPRLARMLVRAARAGTADIIKFQLVFADELATREYPYYGLFKGLEMSDAAWRAVADDAAAAGLGLVFDVFGERSLELAVRLGARGVKLHASDFFNRALLDAALRDAPHVYLALGGIEYPAIAAALADRAADLSRLTLMYGFQGEPTALEQNHIARIGALREFVPGASIGFMDHADGASDEAGWLGALALGFGASTIEKHITLNREIEMEDWVSAIDPPAFARYAERIRRAARALGSPALELTEAEREYGRRAVKAIVARRPIAAGAVLAADDLVALRAPLPEGRTVLRQMERALGRRAHRDLAAGEPLCLEDLT